VRGLLTLAALCLPLPALAGTVVGRVELVEKGGKKAVDLSDVVVWVEGVKTAPRPARAGVTMARKSFQPHLVVVPAGSTVDFTNEDPVAHNAFSLTRDSQFDLGLYKKPQSAARTFDKPGVVRVYCNIHPQMSAIVVVTDSPYFARTGADGRFVIEGVPPGRYTLTAWHERASEASAPVTVPTEGQVEASLSLDGSRYKRAQHRRKDGSEYGSDDGY
jgi:plastocyanin